MAQRLPPDGTPDDAAAERDRRRSAFMKDLAHELATPLTPIAGYLKLLQTDRLGPLSPAQRKAVGAMSTSVARLARIVDNLADFASLDAGPATVSAAPVDPDALAEEVANEVQPYARDARLHVEVRRAGGGPVLADPKKLRQALANVLQNAVKYSPHGGEILIDVTRDGGRLAFAVYDQGPGLTASEVQRIFEPFQHPYRPEDSRRPGSGFGLPVARRIAEAHGGGFTVESPPHSQPSGARQFAGAKFVIEIALRPATAASASAAPASVPG
jgi:signal transduction histidine kinase